MACPSSPSDLSDAEFARLEPLLPVPQPWGRPWAHPLREILDAMVDVVRTGCQWRQWPREFAPWPTVYWWVRRFRLDGAWLHLNAARRELARRAVGRRPQPSAALLDSRSVETTSVGGVRGDDGAKQLSGRKRQVLVATQGLLLTVTVHSAELQDRAAVPLVLADARERFPRVAHVWVDQGYTGPGKQWIAEHLGWSVEVVRHPPLARGQWVPHGDLADWRTIRFTGERLPPSPKVVRAILPRRWAVERTFSWFGQSRRVSTDYEKLCATSEAMIYAAMSRLMLRRLARR
jgi:putative transposase